MYSDLVRGQTRASSQPSAQEQTFYPILLNLRGKRCLLIGSDPELRSKAARLERAGARISTLAASDSPGDIDGYFLVIASGLSKAANSAFFERASRTGVLFHAVDDPARSHFVHPAVLQRGRLIIAISTSGTWPALAVRIRDRLAELFGPEYGAFLEGCASIRARLSELVPEPALRRAACYALVDSNVLERLRAGEPLSFEMFLEELCKPFGIARKK